MVNTISRLFVGCERLDIKIRNKFMDMVGKYVIVVELLVYILDKRKGRISWASRSCKISPNRCPTMPRLKGMPRRAGRWI
jgi:hypothetical protein